MFSKFEADFLPQDDQGIGRMNAHAISGWSGFMEKNAGSTCLRGVYRIHNERSGQRADALIREKFPNTLFSTCFATDWMGRQYAFNPTAIGADGPELYLFDHIVGEAYEMPFHFHEFHNNILFAEREVILMIDYFAEWLQLPDSPDSLNFGDCATHVHPLAQGGKDEPSNLAVTTIDAAWMATKPVAPSTTADA